MTFDEWWNQRLSAWDGGWTGYAGTDEERRDRGLASLGWQAACALTTSAELFEAANEYVIRMEAAKPVYPLPDKVTDEPQS